MWVLTNGLDGGISRIVGDAIHNEHERRSILLSRANTAYGKIANSAHVEELTKLTVVGIVPKSTLSYGEDIATNVSKYCVSTYWKTKIFVEFQKSFLYLYCTDFEFQGRQ